MIIIPIKWLFSVGISTIFRQTHMFGYVFRDSAGISGIDPSRRRGPCKEVLTAWLASSPTLFGVPFSQQGPRFSMLNMKCSKMDMNLASGSNLGRIGRFTSETKQCLTHFNSVLQTRPNVGWSTDPPVTSLAHKRSKTVSVFFQLQVFKMWWETEPENWGCHSEQLRPFLIKKVHWNASIHVSQTCK